VSDSSILESLALLAHPAALPNLDVRRSLGLRRNNVLRMLLVQRLHLIGRTYRFRRRRRLLLPLLRRRLLLPLLRRRLLLLLFLSCHRQNLRFDLYRPLDRHGGGLGFLSHELREIWDQ
jgi:hypothetical protein